MNRIAKSTLSLTLLLGLFANEGFGAGLYLPGTGARASGRAGTFTVKGGDPTTIYHNPAGMFSMEGTQLSLYTGMLLNPAEFQRRDRDFNTGEETEVFPHTYRRNKPGWIPGLFVVTDFGLEDWRFGLGAHGPYGTPSTYFPDTGPTRYQVVDSSVGQIFYELGVAYRPIPQLELAADLVLSDVFVSQTINIHSDLLGETQHPGSDVVATFTLDDTMKPGWLLGMRAHFGDLSIGASWLGAMRFFLKGGLQATLPDTARMTEEGDQVALIDALIEFNGGTPEFELPAKLEVTLADVVRAGILYQVNDKWDIELNYIWTRWSNIPNYPVYLIDPHEPNDSDPEGDDARFYGLITIKDGLILVQKRWRNSHSVRLGSDYVINDTLTVRGGIMWENGAISKETIEPSNIDLNKFGPAAGLSYSPDWLSSDSQRWSIDFAAHALFGEEKTVTRSQGSLNLFNDDEPDVTSNGVYNADYFIFSLGVTGKF